MPNPESTSDIDKTLSVSSAAESAFASGLFGPGTVFSVPTQDLTSDTLISVAPRTKAPDGKSLPTLGGILLLAKLGQGGMGAVYYGIHPRLKKEVAVKVLPIHLAQQHPEMVERFFREAQIAARVQSPHLVSVTDVNKEGGLAYLVMDYISGHSAGGYLKKLKADRQTGLSESAALDICIAATQGLAAAHAQGIIHRDIKPDNIMLPSLKSSQELNFKGAMLADLGLARSEEFTGMSLTGAQTCMGTPGYLSPEQAKDAKTCGKSADVFSMGATLYALLSGSPPFTGDSLMAVLLKTAQENPEPITRIRKDVTKVTADLIDCCLSKTPHRRYADGSVLLDALRICRSHLENAGGEAAAQAAIQQLRTLQKRKSTGSSAPSGGIENTWAPVKPVPARVKRSGQIYVALALAGLVLLSSGVYLFGRGTTSNSAVNATEITDKKKEELAKVPPPVVDGKKPADPDDQRRLNEKKTRRINRPKPALTLDLGEGVKMDFVAVPGGELALKTEEKRRIAPFNLGQFPVTVAQFGRFVDASGYKTDAEIEGKGRTVQNASWQYISGVSWRNPGFPQGPDHPVVMMSPRDAEEFAKWASEKTGYNVYIPSSVEWWYAADPNMQSYTWGALWDASKANHADITLMDTKNYEPKFCASDNDGFAYTAPIGSFDNASWCGAMDMPGNVWQWCRHPVGLVKYWQHGGAWCTNPELCRTNFGRQEGKVIISSDFGFRVAVKAR